MHLCTYAPMRLCNHAPMHSLVGQEVHEDRVRVLLLRPLVENALVVEIVPGLNTLILLRIGDEGVRPSKGAPADDEVVVEGLRAIHHVHEVDEVRLRCEIAREIADANLVALAVTVLAPPRLIHGLHAWLAPRNLWLLRTSSLRMATGS